MPRAENASTYPSKDSHSTEKITAAIDLYNTAPKDEIFSTHYLQEGILPVFLVITNDGDKPISVTKMQRPTRHRDTRQAGRTECR